MEIPPLVNYLKFTKDADIFIKKVKNSVVLSCGKYKAKFPFCDIDRTVEVNEKILADSFEDSAGVHFTTTPVITEFFRCIRNLMDTSKFPSMKFNVNKESSEIVGVSYSEISESLAKFNLSLVEKTDNKQFEILLGTAQCLVRFLKCSVNNDKTNKVSFSVFRDKIGVKVENSEGKHLSSCRISTAATDESTENEADLFARHERVSSVFNDDDNIALKVGASIREMSGFLDFINSVGSKNLDTKIVVDKESGVFSFEKSGDSSEASSQASGELGEDVQIKKNVSTKVSTTALKSALEEISNLAETASFQLASWVEDDENEQRIKMEFKPLEGLHTTYIIACSE